MVGSQDERRAVRISGEKSGLADADRVFAALGMPEAAELWRDGWALSQASYDPENVFFLKPTFVREACLTLGMTAQLREAMEASLAAFEEQPELKRLAWHWHCLYFPESGQAGGLPVERRNDLPRSWTPLPEDRMKAVGLFDALVLISALTRIRGFHKAKGIPDDISLDTLTDLELCIRRYRSRRGHWGLDVTHWLLQHFTGRIYKLGRLQFNFNRFQYDFHAFRRVRDGRVMVLAGDGMCFRTDGFFNDTNGIPDPAGAWTAEFTANGELIRGHPVSAARGAVQRKPVELRATDWKEVLRKGDPTLGVHIAATGPMDHAACGESFRTAVDFFTKRFPEHVWEAFVCGSWLLDRQFEDYLAATSNIVRFLQEYYLFPLPGAGDSAHFRNVFDDPAPDLDNVPQDTSLQRALVQHVKAGKHWHGGGGVIFAEDLDWARQVYRKQEKTNG